MALKLGTVFPLERQKLYPTKMMFQTDISEDAYLPVGCTSLRLRWAPAPWRLSRCCELPPAPGASELPRVGCSAPPPALLPKLQSARPINYWQKENTPTQTCVQPRCSSDSSQSCTTPLPLCSTVPTSHRLPLAVSAGRSGWSREECRPATSTF